MNQPRTFIAALAAETNSFAPFPTGRSAFEEEGIRRDASRQANGMCAEALGVFRRRAEAAGHAVIESISAYAQPGGPVVRQVFEALRDTILADLRAAMPVDAVLLLLHGAMIADGYDDCEGDLLAAVRSIAPQAVIGASLDPHCHLTTPMVAAADMITIFKEYPHDDVAPTASALFDGCEAKRTGRAHPVPALIDTAMIGFYPTYAQPMRGIVDGVRAREATGAILSGSIAHGFPWGDVSDTGTRVLVYADGDAETAEREARAIGQALYDAREALLPRYPGIEESLDWAAALGGRVVIGDHSDNPGGGAPSDSSFFLAAIRARGLRDVAIGGFWDPVLARLCADAGVGARLPVRLGGKMGPSSGMPVDLLVEVAGIAEDHGQDAFGVRDLLGLSVWLRSAGIDMVVTSVRSQVYGLDFFTGLGIVLPDKRLVVVKSSRHFEHSFAPFADHLWTASSPGALSLDFAAMPYAKRARDYHPAMADPWAPCGSARLLPLPSSASRTSSTSAT